jgi:hypothetical protein
VKTLGTVVKRFRGSVKRFIGIVECKHLFHRTSHYLRGLEARLPNQFIDLRCRRLTVPAGPTGRSMPVAVSAVPTGQFEPAFAKVPCTDQATAHPWAREVLTSGTENGESNPHSAPHRLHLKHHWNLRFAYSAGSALQGLCPSCGADALRQGHVS